MTYSSNCYKADTNELNLFDAKDDCESQGAQLTNIIDADEDAFLVSIMCVLTSLIIFG